MAARTPQPPAPWYRGIIRNPVEGMRVGTQVLFRRAREGGWRVMSRTRQVLLAEKAVAHYVISLREGGAVVPAVDQDQANRHLADIFHGRVRLGRPIPGTSYTELSLARD